MKKNPLEIYESKRYKSESEINYFTIEEVCDILNISHVTLNKYRNEGKIESINLPNGGIRFHSQSVYNFLANILFKDYDLIKNLNDRLGATINIWNERFAGRSGAGTRRLEGQDFDTYRFIWNEHGWIVLSNLPMNGISQNDRIKLCDPHGFPFFLNSLDHDYITYPKEVPDYIGYLWKSVRKGELNKNQLQEEMNKIADWINLCEKNRPHYNGYY